MYIEGYASLFNEVDLGGDIIKPGAFATCLLNRPSHQIKMLYQHDVTQPIGVWNKIIETRKGLFVQGKVTIEASLGRDASALVRSGALDGLSIGFRALQAERSKARNRHLLEIDLIEISLVTFPMQLKARVLENYCVGHENFAPAIRRVAQVIATLNH